MADTKKPRSMIACDELLKIGDYDITFLI